MKNLLAAIALSVMATQSYGQNLSGFNGQTTEVDGISVTFQVEAGHFIAIMDVRVGRNKPARIEQGLRAIMAATGCTAVYQTGTVFGFQGKGERPTYVPAIVNC